MASIAVFPESASLVFLSGQRKLTLKMKDLEHYMGERARRGNLLPRGCRNVFRIQVIQDSRQ